jgi:hypothetical protein
VVGLLISRVCPIFGDIREEESSGDTTPRLWAASGVELPDSASGTGEDSIGVDESLHPKCITVIIKTRENEKQALTFITVSLYLSVISRP